MFLSSPPEVIVGIFELCHTARDVVALFSTCTKMRDLWEMHSGSILWHVGQRSVVRFDDALMAVRATAIVKTAHLQRELPPNPFPLQELSGAFKAPTPDEFHDVLNLRHLVRCIEYMIVNWQIEEIEGYDVVFQDKFIGYSFEPDEWGSYHNDVTWVENFHRSMYRTLFAGAYFMGPYNEPFFNAAKEGNTDFISYWGGFWKKDGDDTWQKNDRNLVPQELSIDEAKLLEQYAVYNCRSRSTKEDAEWPNPDVIYDPVFGRLAEWLVEDGRKRGEQDLSLYPDQMDYAHGDVVRLVGCFEHLREKIKHGHRVDPGRKVSIVIFGTFALEEVTMPLNAEDAINMFLGSEILPPEVTQQENGSVGSLLRYSIKIDLPLRLLKRLVYGNDNEENRDAPYILQFFSYTLRKHFRRTFSSETFDPYIFGRAYTTLANPDLFCPHGPFYGWRSLDFKDDRSED